MRILVLTHYYAPEYGAPQRRWSALVSRFIAAGHRVTVAAPVPHYPSGRPTVEQRRDHRVGGAEHGAHGETVLGTAYLPHRGDTGTRTADHLVAALDALCRLRRRFGRPEDRPEVIVATALRSSVVALGKRVVHRQVTDWQTEAYAVVTTTSRFATGRHVTALLEGEAADIVRDSGAGDVLPPEDVAALVELWRGLAADRSRTAVRASGRDWVSEHADDDELARTYLEILREVVAD